MPVCRKFLGVFLGLFLIFAALPLMAGQGAEWQLRAAQNEPDPLGLFLKNLNPDSYKVAECTCDGGEEKCGDCIGIMAPAIVGDECVPVKCLRCCDALRSNPHGISPLLKKARYP